MPVDLRSFRPESTRGETKGRFIEELAESRRQRKLEEQEKTKNLVLEDYKIWLNDFGRRFPEWDIRISNIGSPRAGIYDSRFARSGDRHRGYKPVLDVFFDEDGTLYLANASIAQFGNFSLPKFSEDAYSDLEGNYGYDFNKYSDIPQLRTIEKGHWTTNEGVAKAFDGGSIAQSGHMFSEGDAVYSYGHHFPIAMRLPDGTILWNEDTYSTTTARHKGQVLRELGREKLIPTEGAVMERIAGKSSTPGATKIDDVDPDRAKAKIYNIPLGLQEKYPSVREKIESTYSEKAKKDMAKVKYELEMLQSMVQNALKRKQSLAFEQLYPEVYDRYGRKLPDLARLSTGRVIDAVWGQDAETQEAPE